MRNRVGLIALLSVVSFLAVASATVWTLRSVSKSIAREAYGTRAKIALTGATYGFRCKFGRWPVTLDEIISKANKDRQEYLIKMRDEMNLALDIESLSADREFKARILVRKYGGTVSLRLDSSNLNRVDKYRLEYYEPRESMGEGVKDKQQH